ncbi:cAMP receptor protein [Caloramator mitchellensis]|uniref:cAMP receptor protein n=1 Tax=Caloramator mitchellensis TaxID=908809 RepID=A0A0R3JQU1_CALMK|nr:Crp/Fnr family transcriptional regulator [Caloramator mitchellensis]KRQ85809.1 cAMP receptor protein [Caloramator mitchellensis]
MNNEFLSKISIFKELDDECLSKISALLIEKRYDKGSLIFMEGEAAQAVYFVKKGKVKIYKTGQDGKEHILNILSDGEVFAESCLFGMNKYPASAEAFEDTGVLFIKIKELEKLLENYPKIAIGIIKTMGKRLQMVSKQIENLALRDAFGKTAMLLMDLVTRKFSKIYDGIEVETELSRQEMASMVGLTRETFTRALSKLKDYGAIEFERDKIRIINIEKLKEFIE